MIYNFRKLNPLGFIRGKRKGFSLLEVIIAVGIFAIVIISATGIFQKVIESQRSAIAAQNTQESIRYAMEVVSKEMRLAFSSGSGIDNKYCAEFFGPVFAGSNLSPVETSPDRWNKVFNTFDWGGDDALYFYNKDENCVAYYLSDDSLMTVRQIGPNPNDYYIASSTPDELKISNLRFIVKDDIEGVFPRVKQPLVTIKMDVEMKNEDIINKQAFKMQTTVSGRYYE